MEQTGREGEEEKNKDEEQNNQCKPKLFESEYKLLRKESEKQDRHNINHFQFWELIQYMYCVVFKV